MIWFSSVERKFNVWHGLFQTLYLIKRSGLSAELDLGKGSSPLHLLTHFICVILCCTYSIIWNNEGATLLNLEDDRKLACDASSCDSSLGSILGWSLIDADLILRDHHRLKAQHSTVNSGGLKSGSLCPCRTYFGDHGPSSELHRKDPCPQWLRRQPSQF